MTRCSHPLDTSTAHPLSRGGAEERRTGYRAPQSGFCSWNVDFRSQFGQARSSLAYLAARGLKRSPEI